MRGFLIALCVFSILGLLALDVATAAPCPGGKCNLQSMSIIVSPAMPIPNARKAPSAQSAPAHTPQVKAATCAEGACGRPVLRVVKGAARLTAAVVRAPVRLTKKVATVAVKGFLVGRAMLVYGRASRRNH